MIAVMSQNPRGLLQVNDEATSLITSMNMYRGGRGSDRQIYTSLWSRQPINVDRRGNIDNPLIVPDPFLGFIGGMVPDMIGSIWDKQGRHDGFPDRFIFVYPNPVPKPEWTDDGIPDGVVKEWSKIIGRLYAIPMRIENTRVRPQVVNFSPEGRAAWRELYNAHQAEYSEAGFQSFLTGPWAKLGEYAGRFVHGLHMLESVSDPAQKNMSAIPDVPAKTVRNAWRLVACLKSHTRRVYAANRKNASVIPDVAPVAVQIMALMEKRDHWQGTCTALLKKLAELGGDTLKRRQDWPNTAKGLRESLKRLAPALRSNGFDFTFGDRTGAGCKTSLMHIHRVVPLGVGQSEDEPCDAPADPAEECPPPSPDDREVFDL